MEFYSTKNKELSFSFKEAVLSGLAPDGGLFMPKQIPQFDSLFLRQLPQFSFHDIACEVSKLWFGDVLTEQQIKTLVQDAFNFPVPLILQEKGVAFLELFHGPTLAFKDFGARFMARLMSLLTQNNTQKLHILVATSGDTGGAVADGFANVPGIVVTILYPKGKVSPFQEYQIANKAENIRAVSVEGSFDDCQDLVKKAFVDPEIRKNLFITSANSINIARLLPQSFYYIYTYAQLMGQGIRDVSFAIPSGNFGNLGAGLLAKKMGLPIHSLVAGTNINDTIPRFLNTQAWKVNPTQSTLSNAMDVSNPSNWERIWSLFEEDLAELKNTVYAYSFTDEQTLEAMEEMRLEQNYIMCPHTSVAYLAAQKFRQNQPGPYAQIVVSTAHPGKFKDSIPDSYSDLKKRMSLPSHYEGWENSEIKFVSIPNSYDDLKSFMLK